MVKLQLLCLLAIGVATPYLYAQCIPETSCTTAPGVVQCKGNNPQQGGGSENPAYWLGGSSPCGELYIRGVDSHNTCGQGIATECA